MRKKSEVLEREFVLGSASERRKQILDMIGLKYTVVTSDIDEDCDETDPSEYAKQISYMKAKAVAKKVKGNSVVVTADTVIYKNGEEFGKPKDRAEAIKMIKALSNGVSVATTGVTIFDMYTNHIESYTDNAYVTFKRMTDEEIEWYVDNEKSVYDCAGYALLGKASIFLEKVNGDYNTVFGISPSFLFEKLKDFGYTFENFTFEK